jgi:hypothetical protein
MMVFTFPLQYINVCSIFTTLSNLVEHTHTHKFVDDRCGAFGPRLHDINILLALELQPD